MFENMFERPQNTIGKENIIEDEINKKEKIKVKDILEYTALLEAAIKKIPGGFLFSGNIIIENEKEKERYEKKVKEYDKQSAYEIYNLDSNF